MSQKTYSLVAGVIFLLVALAHLFRVVMGAEWVVEGWGVPLWTSWVALFVAAYLAYEGLRLGRKPPPAA